MKKASNNSFQPTSLRSAAEALVLDEGESRMGLDSIEILMKVEDTFSITIDDKEAAAIRTPGDLTSAIMNHLGPRQSVACQTSRSFYKLRTTLSSLFSIKKSAIYPSTPTESLIPTISRRRHWAALSGHLNLAIPPLCRTKWLKAIIMSLIVAPIAVAVVLANSGSISVTHAWLLAFLSIPVGIALDKATLPLACTVRSDCQDVGSLAKAILVINDKEFGDAKEWIEGDVWVAVQRIVVEQLDMPIEKVTRDAHFIDDLGLG